MQRPALAAALALSLGACAPVHESRDVPASAEWITVLELDARGVVVAASPLYRRDPAAPLPVHVDASRPVLVAGLTSASLGALTEVVTSTDALSLATGCAPRLPAPVWAARLVDGALVETRVADVPALTAPWLEDRCTLDAPPTVVVDCGPTACLARATPTRRRCTWNVDPTVSCGSPPLTVTIGVDDEVCFEDSELDACTIPARYPEPAAQLLCEVPIAVSDRACNVDVFSSPAAPPWTPPDLAGRTISLADVTPWVPGSLSTFGDLRAEATFDGFLRGLVVLDDGRVHVTRAPGPPTEPPECGAERGDVAWLLDTIDRDALRVVETSTVPTCLGTLERDPLGGGLVGLFRRDDAWHLGRFDARGRELASIALPVELLAGLRAEAVALRVVPETTRVIAMLARDDPNATELFDVELATMRVEHHWPMERTTWSFDFEDPRRIGFVARRGATTCTLDVDRDVEPSCVDGGCLVPEWAAFNYVAWDYLVHAATDRTLISIGTAAEGVWVCEAPGEAGPRSVAPWERSLQPGRMHPYPRARELVLVTGVTNDGEAWRTAVVLLDPVRRQLLPGTWLLDAGLTSVIREDAEGRLWLMSPWDAKVTRLDLR
ncbi:hypothetical protein L6R52_22855 [Myxococcota bacterium]|nr:hypothetical protein [Myxococcota bacterium]